jgi:hypothetical protein
MEKRKGKLIDAALASVWVVSWEISKDDHSHVTGIPVCLFILSTES